MFGVDWLFGASGLVSVVSLGLIVWGWLFRDGYLGLIELVVWDKLVTWGWFVDVVCLGLVGWLGLVVCSTFTGGGCEAVFHAAPVPCRKESQPTYLFPVGQ